MNLLIKATISLIALSSFLVHAQDPRPTAKQRWELFELSKQGGHGYAFQVGVEVMLDTYKAAQEVPSCANRISSVAPDVRRVANKAEEVLAKVNAKIFPITMLSVVGAEATVVLTKIDVLCPQAVDVIRAANSTSAASNANSGGNKPKPPQAQAPDLISSGVYECANGNSLIIYAFFRDGTFLSQRYKSENGKNLDQGLLSGKANLNDERQLVLNVYAIENAESKQFAVREIPVRQIFQLRNADAFLDMIPLESGQTNTVFRCTKNNKVNLYKAFDDQRRALKGKFFGNTEPRLEEEAYLKAKTFISPLH